MLNSLMVAYQPELWHDLFVAVGGAAAALTGLLFVAVSINLKQILNLRPLTRRAFETLSMLVGLLLVSVVMLVPGQSNTVLGIELLGFGLLGSAPAVARARHRRNPNDPLHWHLFPIGVTAAYFAPVLVAGVTLIIGSGGGLYWLVAAIVLGLIGAVGNAWVLLVEILR